MLERAVIAGQYPTRPEVYGDSTLRRALAIPPEQVRALVERAVPRP
jgi:hypothetical protein